MAGSRPLLPLGACNSNGWCELLTGHFSGNHVVPLQIIEMGRVGRKPGELAREFWLSRYQHLELGTPDRCERQCHSAHDVSNWPVGCFHRGPAGNLKAARMGSRLG